LSADRLAMMPWFPRDFIAATRAMRIAERCAYRELLDFQWELGVLPSDVSRLARLIGFTDAEFADAWPGIQHKFIERDGGLVNERLEEHRVKALEQRDKKRRAAETTNAKRDAKRSGERAQEVNPLRNASATPPSPSPSPEVKEIASQSMGELEFAKNFATLKAIYPKRSGDQRWPSAEKHIRARLREGSTWVEILDGVKRYAEWVRAAGKEGTETVKQAATFVGTDRGFTEAFELPRSTNGTGKQSYQPRLSAVERVRLANEKWLRDGDETGGPGVVIDG
jgi:uncharacterized protein YdaU (DUF1376 family)